MQISIFFIHESSFESCNLMYDIIQKSPLKDEQIV
jgi:hypothetical protein